MFINFLLEKIQLLLNPLYKNSFILQSIDWLIFVNILLVIFTSTFAQSDTIGYFALFAIVLTVIKFCTKPDFKIEINFLDLMLILYFIFVCISVAGSSLFYLSLKGFFKTLTYLFFYVSVIYYLKNNKDKIKWLFVTFCICAFYESVFAFLQNAGAVEEISGWQDMSHLNPEEVMTRVYGTLKPFNPNLFGGYMLSIIPAFITLPAINKKLTICSVIGGLMAIIALILTGCRGAYIGLFFELAVLFLITYKFLKSAYKKMFVWLSGITSCVILSIVMTISSLRARIFSIFAMRSDSSNSFRFNVYNSCVNMFKDNWLLGIGCGNQNFREIYGLYMKTGFDALSAYNIYLETAVESGIFALISFVGFLVGIIIKTVNYIKNTKTAETVYLIAVLLSVIGLMTHGIVDTVFFRPQIQFVFWTMVGIIRVLGE